MGIALAATMACAVAINVNAGTITSSPGFTPTDMSARCKLEVPLAVDNAYSAPTYFLYFFSNSSIILEGV
ncbi:Uncharacterised protein [Staphylococcus aureus]|nr:Uncharacterised protein [Staphylococcus aureus]